MKNLFIILLAVAATSRSAHAASACTEIAEGKEHSVDEVNQCYECQGWSKFTGGIRSPLGVLIPSASGQKEDDETLWCAPMELDYLQITFDEPIKLAGFSIRGNKFDSWVSSLKVYYEDETGSHSYAKNSNGKQIFTGNNDSMSEKEQQFEIPITAISVRIYIESYINTRCMVLELYSCDEWEEVADEGTGNDEYGVSRIRRSVKRRRKRRCRINPSRDCPELDCFKFRKDTFGCPRCACDTEFTGLLEGDILIDSETRGETERVYGYRKDPEGVQRGGAVNARRWTDYKSGGKYLIPYVMQHPDKRTVSVIKNAIKGIEDVSCLKFVQRSNQEYYMRFFKGSGCFSYVGKIRHTDGNGISIGDGCGYLGIAQHEILHAIGFWHEQSRQDRDSHVQILYQNIRSGMESNFNKQNSESYGSPYDFQSVMHYGNKAFSKNGQDTIQALKDRSLKFGQRNGLSTEDIKQINAMYPCDGVTTSSTTRTTRTTRKTRTTRTTRPTRTTRTTTPTTLTTTPSTSCKDELKKFCTKYKKYCRKNQFWTKHCYMSCGHCNSNQCEDTQNACPSWKRYCTMQLYKNYMEKNCKKTCGKC